MNDETEQIAKSGVAAEAYGRRGHCFTRLTKFENANGIFIAYVILPFMAGQAISYFIDLSDYIKEYIGILSFFQKAGVDIRSKSIIIALYVIFLPYWIVRFHGSFVNRGVYPNNVKNLRVSKLLYIVFASALMFVFFCFIVFVGFPDSALIHPSSALKKLISASYFDVTFSIFFSFVVPYGIGGFFYFFTLCQYQLIIRTLCFIKH